MSTGVKIGIIIALAAVASTVGFLKFRSDPIAALESEAKAVGLPLTPDEIRAPAVPDNDNGSPLIDEAMDRVPSITSSGGDIKAITAALASSASPEDYQGGQEALRNLRPALDLMAKATKRPHCIFPFDWSNAANVVANRQLAIKNAVKAFCLSAEQHSREGNAEGALADMKMADRVSNLLSENPFAITMLVKIACIAIIERAFDRVIGEHRSDAEFLRTAHKLHGSFGPLPGFGHVLRTELVMSLAELKQLKSERDLPVKDVSDIAGEFTPEAKSFVKKYILAGYIAFAKSLPKNSDDWDGILEATAKGSRASTPTESPKTPGFKLLAINSFAFADAMPVALINAAASRKLTDTAIRLFEQKARKGSLPKSLPDFGADRIDPFSGKPFVYSRSGGGFTLYSFGRNRVDDGGNTKKDTVISFE